MMRKVYNNKGITLVALIVTIIILLILAGVTFSFILNENGVINKSQLAVNEYEKAAENENRAELATSPKENYMFDEKIINTTQK